MRPCECRVLLSMPDCLPVYRLSGAYHTLGISDAINAPMVLITNKYQQLTYSNVLCINAIS